MPVPTQITSSFLSTPSARRATRCIIASGDDSIFLSTPSARRATYFYCPNRILWDISIHALREEGDEMCLPVILHRRNFYPRPPRGGRQQSETTDRRFTEFLSTPSARRATYCPNRILWDSFISIHALREEGDLDIIDNYIDDREFLSTPSARRATVDSRIFTCSTPNFYPRPPRGGRRNAGQGLERPAWYFYPRPPRGGRPCYPC